MKDSEHGTIQSYTIGFLLSIIFTLLAFIFVMIHVGSHHVTFSHTFLTIAVVGLAIAQLFVQLIFFLHLGRRANSQWNIIVMFFAIIIIAILVGGSLWIMQNLNYNMMPSPKRD